MIHTMNLTRLFTAVALLAITQAAHSQTPRKLPSDGAPPPPLSAPTLSSNYRLTLTAKSGDKALGEISVLTCSSAIEASGFLAKPADDIFPATTLSIRGTLTEQEGGSLMLGYTFGVVTPVVSQSMTNYSGSSSQRSGSGSKTGDAKADSDAKPEPRGNISRSFIYRDHISSGALRVKAGSTYELLTTGGVVYSLTISPEPQK